MHIAKGQRATSDSFSVLQFGFQLWIYKQSSPKAAPQATVTSDDGQRSWFAFATPSLPKWVTCSLHAEFRNYKNHLSQKWLHGCTKRVTLASVSRVGWELEVAGGGCSARGHAGPSTCSASAGYSRDSTRCLLPGRVLHEGDR